MAEQQPEEPNRLPEPTPQEAVAALAEWVADKLTQRSTYRIRLRTMFAIMTVLCADLAFREVPFIQKSRAHTDAMHCVHTHNSIPTVRANDRKFLIANTKTMRRMLNISDSRLLEMPIEGKELDCDRIADVDFEQLDTLGHVSFHNSTAPDWSMLQEVSKAPKLWSIDLGGTTVANDDLLHIRDAENLSYLSLFGTRITNDALEQVANFERLGFLDLENTNVTDEGLRHLEGHKNLYAIILTNTKITGEGLLRLAKLPNIQSIHIRHMQLPEDAVDAAHAANPRLKIWQNTVKSGVSVENPSLKP